MKTLNKLYIVAAAALSLTACNDDSYLEAFQGDPNAVRFSVGIADDSQATLQTKVNTFDDVNVNSAFEDGDEVTVSAGDQEAVTYKLSGGAWVPGSANYLIWKTEDNLQFNAFYPASGNNASMTTFTQPTSFSSVADLKAADYMTFSGPKSRSEGETVALQMERKMARVIFVVDKVNNQYQTFTAKSITMNINSKGYKDGAVEAGATTITTLPQENSKKFYALVTPTTKVNAEFLTIDGTADGTDVTLKITGIPEMKAGNSYTYNLTIGKTVAKVSGVQIKAWNDGGVIDNGTGVAEEVVVKNYPYADATTHTIYTNAVGQITTDLVNQALSTSQTLAVNGPINELDWKTITDANNVEYTSIDLSKATTNNSTVIDFDYSCFNTTLTSVTLPPTVTIANGFSGCTALQNLTFPSHITAIGPRAFKGCTGLNTITFEGEITTIDISAFEGCTNLNQATFTCNEVTVGASAFKDCTYLQNVTFNGTVKSLGAGVFHKSGECCNTVIDLKKCNTLPTTDNGNPWWDTTSSDNYSSVYEKKILVSSNAFNVFEENWESYISYSYIVINL